MSTATYVSTAGIVEGEQYWYYASVTETVNTVPYVYNTNIVTISSSVDTTPPVITLTGSTDIEVSTNGTLPEYGATATDNTDGTVAVVQTIEFTALRQSTVETVTTIDTSTPGVYRIAYNATDAAGNIAVTKYRIITVLDTIPPVLTLNSGDVTTIYVDKDAELPATVGATATDSVAGAVNLTQSIIYKQHVNSTPVNAVSVNTHNTGVYTVTYTATDLSNNVTTKTQTIIVRATDIPVITLNGSNVVNINYAANLPSSVGATAKDIFNNNVPVTATYTFKKTQDGLTTSVNSIDTTCTGIYEIVYSAVDSNNASAEPILQTVNIGIGIATYTDVNPPYGDLWYKAVIETSTDDVTTNTVYATIGDDIISRPIINVLGDNPYYMHKNELYVEQGAVANDPNDGNLTSEIIITGDVNNTTTGSYNVSYSVANSLGRTSVEMRTVVVLGDVANLSGASIILGGNTNVTFAQDNTTQETAFNTPNIILSKNATLNVNAPIDIKVTQAVLGEDSYFNGALSVESANNVTEFICDTNSKIAKITSSSYPLPHEPYYETVVVKPVNNS